RPQSFEDLVGQEHVARTLANAIEGNRVAHAFLFTGVRGVGKTTSARLLAKCLNCLGADGTAKGPTARPCQVCAACKEIAAGNDIDVQEIDGASYNGVDEVRRLQEGLAFRPARDRFKIYIVDEVHMLSNAAWNAFLKTLEEPPPHVKFIFATTEVHKVPVTILSRCQRYDFKLISTQLIAKRLEEVLALEHIEADGGALAVLAREAAGSMRDAMSLLDQVIAFSGEKLNAEDVARVLGVADRRVLHELGSALVSGDAKAALRVVDGLAQQGFDLPHVARDVLQHLRNLVVAKVSGEEGRELLDLADEEVADVMALAKETDGDDLMRLYQGFSRSFDEIVRSGQPRAALEMLLVRLARRPPLLPLDELLARLGELERRLGGAPPAPPRGSGSSSSSGSGGGKGGSVPQRGSVSLSDGGPGRENPTAVTRTPAEPPALIRPAPQAPTPQAPAAPAARPPTVPVTPIVAARQNGRAQANGDGGHGTGDKLASWRRVVERVRATRPPLASILEHALPMEIGPERICIALDELLASQVREADAFSLVTQEIRSLFGDVSLLLEDKKPHDAIAPTLASVALGQRREELTAARNAVAEHPLVRHAITVFNADLREVRLPAGSED
ncbi:MAG TPA: DNA polymerase III subunit gamma/tau, partial [Polyangiaceae bacterium]|nr:DNA polymerase III subunit gamma/tau [Polyangiaceae bacterium]